MCICLLTGPDSIRDHRSTVEPEHRYVGIGKMSSEGTSETNYVWRAAPGTPFPRPKSGGIGEIGWSVPDRQDWSYANTARQIMVSVTEGFKEVYMRVSFMFPISLPFGQIKIFRFPPTDPVFWRADPEHFYHDFPRNPMILRFFRAVDF